MKIRVSTISLRGHTLQERLSAASLNKRMAQGEDNDILFVEDPSVVISLIRTSTGAEAKGTISAKVKQPCARCFEESVHSVEIPYHITIRPTSYKNDPEDGDGIVFYHGDHVDIGNYLEDTLILDLSPFWSHALGENGKCSIYPSK